MNITQLNYFIETAKCLNFSEASKRVYISQPSLGRQITSLESELNIQLFIRSTKGLKLTPAGMVLVNKFEKLKPLYLEAIEKAEQVSRGYNSRLRIGIIEGINLYGMITNITGYFEKEHPNIKIFFVQYSFKKLLDAFYSEDLDAVISYDFHLKGRHNMTTHVVTNYHPAWLIPKSNPLSQREHISFSDMENEDLLIVKNEECKEGVQLIIDCCRQYGNFYPKFVFVEDMNNVLLCLNTSTKFALLNSETCDSETVIKHPLVQITDQENHLLCGRNEHNKNFALNIFLNYIADPQNRFLQNCPF